MSREAVCTCRITAPVIVLINANSKLISEATSTDDVVENVRSPAEGLIFLDSELENDQDKKTNRRCHLLTPPFVQEPSISFPLSAALT